VTCPSKCSVNAVVSEKNHYVRIEFKAVFTSEPKLKSHVNFNAGLENQIQWNSFSRLGDQTCDSRTSSSSPLSVKFMHCVQRTREGANCFNKAKNKHLASVVSER
jgi:hypothetical protein